MPSRRSRKVKNLEEEVEYIFSQDECEEENKVVLSENQKFTKTAQPEKIMLTTPPKQDPKFVRQDLQTPRRSCRKSVKPAQDYDDIVKSGLRFCTRSGKKALSAEAERDENVDEVNAQPKWTPAKVGRVSQKRSRRSKRVEKVKHQNEKNIIPEIQEAHENIEEEIIGEDVSFEKVTEMVKPSNCSLNEAKQTMQRMELMGAHDSNMTCLLGSQESLNKEERIKSVGHESVNSDNQCVQLLQDDSEDDHESTEKCAQEEICIIYENNIGNKDDTQHKSSKSMPSLAKENSFGSLKSRNINISDLGLSVISQEEGKEDHMGYQMKTPTEEVEEMPSLIMCDDDEVNSKQLGALNETFEANSNVDVEIFQKKNEDTMEVLQLSDDDSATPKKHRQIVLTDTTSANNVSLVSNSKNESPVREIVQVNKLPSTPKPKMLPTTPITMVPKFPGTPQQSRRQYRLPTPYRNRNFKLNDKSTEDIGKTSKKEGTNSPLISLTTLEPKEIVLRGIRKRSLSVCVNGQQQQNSSVVSAHKQNRMVSFHSPANQTTIIDDLDSIIAKSLKKRKQQEKDSVKKFVTTRRKRSLSLDESFMSPSITSKLPRPVVIQNVANITKNATASRALKRTKLPNFAAIHEKQFNKMENLVDHVTRKQERSKNLINSATKTMSASAQKTLLLNKSITNKAVEKPRALKRIDLNHNPQKPGKSDLLNKKSAIPKKHAFNLSTSVVVKPTAPAATFLEKANTSHFCGDNKGESRLQRHMELFKGRAAATKASSASRRNEVILKGVRSNRRFELQMQHRKNLEQ